MPSPKVFEIVFKVEVEAMDYDVAVAEARERVGSKSMAGVHVEHGVIRDDDLFGGGSDIISRHTNHVAVLGPKDRQELESIIGSLGSTIAGISEEERKRLHTKAANILGWQGG